MQESAFLLSNVTIEIIDEEDNLSNKYHYENGIISFVEYMNENKAPLSKVIHFDNVKSKIEVDIACNIPILIMNKFYHLLTMLKPVTVVRMKSGLKQVLRKPLMIM